MKSYYVCFRQLIVFLLLNLKSLRYFITVVDTVKPRGIIGLIIQLFSNRVLYVLYKAGSIFMTFRDSDAIIVFNVKNNNSRIPEC